MLEYDLDFSEDFQFPAGTDYPWSYQWQPLDLTGCTASFIADFGTIAFTISVAVNGDDTVSTITGNIPNATTNTLVKGNVYNWKVLVTFPTVPSTIVQMGHGEIAVY